MIAGLVALIFGTGAGNYVSALIYRVNGTWSSAFVDGTGEGVAMTLGPGVPLPDWFPRLPGAVTISAGLTLSGPTRRQFANLDVVTVKSTADIERYYLEHLAAAGFVQRSSGQEAQDPRTLAFLGIDRMIGLDQPENGWTLRVTIRSPNGLILQSRIVGVAWWDHPLPPGAGAATVPPRP